MDTYLIIVLAAPLLYLVLEYVSYRRQKEPIFWLNSYEVVEPAYYRFQWHGAILISLIMFIFLGLGLWIVRQYKLNPSLLIMLFAVLKFGEEQVRKRLAISRGYVKRQSDAANQME